MSDNPLRLLKHEIKTVVISERMKGSLCLLSAHPAEGMVQCGRRAEQLAAVSIANSVKRAAMRTFIPETRPVCLQNKTLV